MNDEYYTQDGDIRRLLKYITGQGKNRSREKVKYCAGKGLTNNCDTAAEQILQIQRKTGFGVHTSTENVHIHIALNAVNYKSLKKWHQGRREFNEFKNEILKITNTVLKEWGYPMLILR